MKIALREFRFSCIDFELKTRNRLTIMLDRIARVYGTYVNNPIKLENTNILLINIHNELIDRNLSIGLLGCRMSGYIGGFGMHISEKHLLSLDDSERRLYLLSEFQKALFEFLEHYGYFAEKKYFEQSFNIVVNELNLWGKYTKEYVSKNKKYSCQLEVRECWGFEEFRLRFKDMEQNKEKIVFVGNKNFLFFSELNMNPNSSEFMKLLLSTPQTFNDFKWEKNIFEFFLGKEKYIFNVQTEEIQKHEDDETTNKY